MDNYIVPKIFEKRFTCPHCGALAGISWVEVYLDKDSDGDYYFHYNSTAYCTNTISISTCKACGEFHIWLDEEMISPLSSGVPSPNSDMPENVKNIYNEAKEVYPYSAKASAALLRLAVQHLCKELGGEGKNINDDIGKFVKDGLSIRIQRALDTIRVIGNNAVHPGTIDLDDNKETAALMFKLINIIVNEMITQPKQIDEIYSSLPQGTLDAIEKRDQIV